MKKFFSVFLFLIFFFNELQASHIVAGECYYTWLGPGAAANTSSYRITLRLFTECGQQCGDGTGVACPPDAPIIGIFDNSVPYNRIKNIVLALVSNNNLLLTTPSLCVTAPPVICYKVNIYSATVELNNNVEGYRISYQNCCRAETQNVEPDAATLGGYPGAAFESVIPGTAKLPTGHNSNAVVKLKDTALVCKGSYLILDFGADDIDGDSLSYEFTAAYDGGSFPSALDTQEPDKPLYQPVTYTNGYSGASPLGSRATINPQTGLITGVSPDIPGKYVVNVIVREWRNGINIAEHRKDLLLRVNDCIIPTAKSEPLDKTCDGFTRHFFNSGSNVNIQSWFWDFGVASLSNDTANTPNPVFTYTDTGLYNVTLIVNRQTDCSDTDVVVIKVYPGFFPAFNADPPTCKGIPVSFKDQTRTSYGMVTGWRWNFGIAGVDSDSSNVKNPVFTYADTGTYTIQLISNNSYGCSDTVTKDVSILSPPAAVLHDTLICSIDTLQLTPDPANSYIWSPNYMISSVTATNPFVSPDVPTTYYAIVTNSFGCINRDSVFVDVKSFVTINAGNDTSICRNDTLRLRTVGDALSYDWSPPGSLDTATVKNPVATPLESIVTYVVTGSIGKCKATDNVTLRTVPYPSVIINPDTSICYGRSASLQASGGTGYTWTPVTFLSSINTPNTISVAPTRSIQYTVAVVDNKGCPKPSFASTWVKVRDPLVPATGIRDTSIVMGQSIQLNASGGEQYLWTPSLWLSDPNSPRPVTSPDDDITYIVKIIQLPENCVGYDSVKIKVYLVPPSFYVPTAFSPNGDGKNDVLIPIALGMRSIRYFKVYNRLGNLVFQTTELNKGWDGSYKGNPQDPAAYVWIAQGETYKGEFITKKGTAVLIR